MSGQSESGSAPGSLRATTAAVAASEIVGRLMVCIRCGDLHDVLDASSPSLGTHHWVDGRGFVCPACCLPMLGAELKPWCVSRYRGKS